MSKTLKSLIIAVGCFFSFSILLLILFFRPPITAIVFLAPGYFSTDRVVLNSVADEDIFLNSQYKPNLILDPEDTSNGLYSLLKISGENSYAVTTSSSSQSILFTFSQPQQNGNLPQVYEQGDYLIVLRDITTGNLISTLAGWNKNYDAVIDWVVYNKKTRVLKTFSMTSPNNTEVAYSFGWFDQKVGNTRYSMPGSVLSVYQDKLYVPFEDLTNKQSPAITYIYDFQKDQLSQIASPSNYCDRVNLAIKGGNLYLQESYSTIGDLWFRAPNFLRPKCFTYEKNIDDPSFVSATSSSLHGNMPISATSSVSLVPIQYGNITDYYSLFTALYKTPGVTMNDQESGGTFENFLQQGMQPGTIAGNGQISFNGAGILESTYLNHNDLEEDISFLSNDGLYYKGKQIVAGHPHYWKNDTVVVMYDGDNQDVINILTKIFGKPFIGG